MDNTNSIALKIKNYRKIQNMSQEELAEKSGINVSTIKKYEAEYRNPKPDQLIKIAEALNVSIYEFMDFEITTISDVMSLLTKLDKQTEMQIKGEKDSDGNYIPESITFSFSDNKINQSLAAYLYYKNQMEQIQTSTTKDVNSETIFSDYIKSQSLISSDKISKK